MTLLTKEWSVLFQWFVSTVPRKYIPLLNAPVPFLSLPSPFLPCPSLLFPSLYCLRPPFPLPSFFLPSLLPQSPFPTFSRSICMMLFFLVFFIPCSFTDLDDCKGLWSFMVFNRNESPLHRGEVLEEGREACEPRKLCTLVQVYAVAQWKLTHAWKGQPRLRCGSFQDTGTSTLGHRSSKAAGVSQFPFRFLYQPLLITKSKMLSPILYGLGDRQRPVCSKS